MKLKNILLTITAAIIIPMCFNGFGSNIAKANDETAKLEKGSFVFMNSYPHNYNTIFKKEVKDKCALCISAYKEADTGADYYTDPTFPGEPKNKQNPIGNRRPREINENQETALEYLFSYLNPSVTYLDLGTDKEVQTDYDRVAQALAWAISDGKYLTPKNLSSYTPCEGEDRIFNFAQVKELGSADPRWYFRYHKSGVNLSLDQYMQIMLSTSATVPSAASAKSKDAALGSSVDSRSYAIYERFKKYLSEMYIIPSFTSRKTGQNIQTLTWNESKGYYEAYVADTSGCTANFILREINSKDNKVLTDDDANGYVKLLKFFSEDAVDNTTKTYVTYNPESGNIHIISMDDGYKGSNTVMFNSNKAISNLVHTVDKTQNLAKVAYMNPVDGVSQNLAYANGDYYSNNVYRPNTAGAYLTISKDTSTRYSSDTPEVNTECYVVDAETGIKAIAMVPGRKYYFKYEFSYKGKTRGDRLEATNPGTGVKHNIPAGVRVNTIYEQGPNATLLEADVNNNTINENYSISNRTFSVKDKGTNFALTMQYISNGISTDINATNFMVKLGKDTTKPQCEASISSAYNTLYTLYPSIVKPNTLNSSVTKSDNTWNVKFSFWTQTFTAEYSKYGCMASCNSDIRLGTDICISKYITTEKATYTNYAGVSNLYAYKINKIVVKNSTDVAGKHYTYGIKSEYDLSINNLMVDNNKVPTVPLCDSSTNTSAIAKVDYIVKCSRPKTTIMAYQDGALITNETNDWNTIALDSTTKLMTGYGMAGLVYTNLTESGASAAFVDGTTVADTYVIGDTNPVSHAVHINIPYSQLFPKTADGFEECGFANNSKGKTTFCATIDFSCNNPRPSDLQTQNGEVVTNRLLDYYDNNNKSSCEYAYTVAVNPFLYKFNNGGKLLDTRLGISQDKLVTETAGDKLDMKVYFKSDYTKNLTKSKNVLKYPDGWVDMDNGKDLYSTAGSSNGIDLKIVVTYTNTATKAGIRYGEFNPSTSNINKLTQIQANNRLAYNLSYLSKVISGVTYTTQYMPSEIFATVDYKNKDKVDKTKRISSFDTDYITHMSGYDDSKFGWLKYIKADYKDSLSEDVNAEQGHPLNTLAFKLTERKISGGTITCTYETSKSFLFGLDNPEQECQLHIFTPVIPSSYSQKYLYASKCSSFNIHKANIGGIRLVQ